MNKSTLKYGIEFISGEYHDYVHLTNNLKLDELFPDLEALQELIEKLPREKYPITTVCYDGTKLINAVSIDQDDDSVRITRYFEDGHFQDYFPSQFGLCKSCYLSKSFTLANNERNSFV